MEREFATSRFQLSIWGMGSWPSLVVCELMLPSGAPVCHLSEGRCSLCIHRGGSRWCTPYTADCYWICPMGSQLPCLAHQLGGTSGSCQCAIHQWGPNRRRSRFYLLCLSVCPMWGAWGSWGAKSEQVLVVETLGREARRTRPATPRRATPTTPSRVWLRRRPSRAHTAPNRRRARSHPRRPSAFRRPADTGPCSKHHERVLVDVAGSGSHEQTREGARKRGGRRNRALPTSFRRS